VGTATGESGARTQWPSAVVSDATSPFFSAGVTAVKGANRSVERGDAVTSLSRRYFRGTSSVNRFFSKATLGTRSNHPQLSVSHDLGSSSFEACAVVTLRVTASDRRPSLPGGDRPAIQWSTRARRGARRAGGAAPSDFRRGPAPAAPREPRTPPLPGSPSGDEENAGGMSWAGQLWKQYDPINKIIFPGVGARPTYNERGASRGPRATPSLRSPRVSRRLFPSETTDSTNTRKKSAKNSRKSRTRRPKRRNKRVSARVSCHTVGDERTTRRVFFRVGQTFTIESLDSRKQTSVPLSLRTVLSYFQANLSWASCRSGTSSTRRSW